jgi:integrase/recombinase XerD
VKGKALIEQYINHLVEKKTSKNTAAAYRKDNYQLLSELGVIMRIPPTMVEEHLDWTLVTARHLRAYLKALKTYGYMKATNQRKIAAVKAFFKWMYVQGFLKVNPADNLSSAANEREIPFMLTDEQVEGLLASPSTQLGPLAVRDSIIMRLLYETGMRVSEFVAIQIEDIDLDNCRILIGRGVRQRWISLSIKTRRELAEYLAQARPFIYKSYENSFLIVNHRGEKLTRQGFWLIMKGYFAEAGIPLDLDPLILRVSLARHFLAHHDMLQVVHAGMDDDLLTTTQIYQLVTAQ